MNHVVILGKISIFSGIEVEQLLGVAEISEEVSFDEGAVVFSQGEPASDLYVVLSGSVDVLVGTHPVATLGPGQCFGELAILDRLTRTATIQASEPLKCLKIARSDFEDLLDISPDLSKAIMKVLSARLRDCVPVEASSSDVGS